MSSDNDIPDGVARLQALEAATQNSMPGDPAKKILNEARLFYEFLTEQPQRPPVPTLSLIKSNSPPN